MLYEAGYDKIDLYSAVKGMNQNISTNLIREDESYYIENILPTSLGEAQVRFGTDLSYIMPDTTFKDTVMKAFPFQASDGSLQQALYCNGYSLLNDATFMNIVSDNSVYLVTPSRHLFQPDTYVELTYTTSYGITSDLYFPISSVTLNDDGIGINIEFGENSFPNDLQNFFLEQQTTVIDYFSSNTIKFQATAGFQLFNYSTPGTSIKLIINDVENDFTILSSSIDAITNMVTLIFNENTIPVFSNPDTVTLHYQTIYPQLNSIANSTGYIIVRDNTNNVFLDPIVTGLSTACVPRAEYFANKLWICNGVDDVMTWDGAILEVYTEPVREDTTVFTRIDNTHFTFVAGPRFNIANYAVGSKIQLSVLTVSTLVTTVLAVTQVGNIITINTADALPAFTGVNKLILSYFAKLPKFSFMKAAHDRLWCLGEGAVGLQYRVPEERMKVYISYKPFSLTIPFRFFNETTQAVYFEDLSAKSGGSDNLEAIVLIQGNLAFAGRQSTQVWQGTQPFLPDTPQGFSWVSTLPVGVYHGDLIVELSNDAYFLSSTGFLSFSTLNISKQFAASNTENMDNIAQQYIGTIENNLDYRSCASFKYINGGFCGFKIGQNNVIVSKFNTTLFWWCIFSGDFTNATAFCSDVNDSLYLFMNKKSYIYGDGIGGLKVYGDDNGTELINFMETKYVNSIKNRYANKRYEISVDYSSNVIINKQNNVNIYICGDLRDTFILQDMYQLPLRGDLLGTISLLDGIGQDIDYPDDDAKGFRFDSPSHTIKGRLKFLSSIFSVSVVGQVMDGQFILKRIRLFGLGER